MGKKLSEMTLRELWELFPISLTEHNDKWDGYYTEMETFLEKELSDFDVARISHIGSTAIKDIWAKDIVDILVEIGFSENMKFVSEKIEKIGFTKMCSDGNRVSFNRGYTENGFAEKVYHLHLRFEGDNDELYFRDYMNEFPRVAKEYEELKLSLWKKFEHDRDGYTDAKTDFIKKYTHEAKKYYKNKYVK